MTHICNLGFANHTSSVYSVKSPCDTITPRRFCNTVCSILFIFTVVVFPEWIEHSTSILSGLRSNQLSYGNINCCLSSSHRFIRNVLVPWHKRGILSYHAFTIFFTNTSYNSRNSKTTYRVVRPKRFELPTHRLKGDCSNQLSYERKWKHEYPPTCMTLALLSCQRLPSPLTLWTR